MADVPGTAAASGSRTLLAHRIRILRLGPDGAPEHPGLLVVNADTDIVVTIAPNLRMDLVRCLRPAPRPSARSHGTRVPVSRAAEGVRCAARDRCDARRPSTRSRPARPQDSVRLWTNAPLEEGAFFQRSVYRMLEGSDERNPNGEWQVRAGACGGFGDRR